MKILLSLSNSLSGKTWYHGSPKQFSEFNIKADRLNRGSNPEGVYLTTDRELAKEFAGKGGYVYVVKPNLKNIFYYRKTQITERLKQAYRDAILQFTHYKKDWVDQYLIPEMVEENRMKPDFSGELKSYAYVKAGYDGFEFMDMRGMSLVVFNPLNLEVVRRELA